MESDPEGPSSISSDTVTILVNQEPIDSSVLDKLTPTQRKNEQEEADCGREKKVAAVAYVTSLSLSSVCLCCTGQQARRCSLNVDLQLAAELGKTLLERNKELENSLKHQQAIIDDQAQEIEYLNKQTTALREVNDSRLRIYEQLEISIGEMEKTNIRLTEDTQADKARIKCLGLTASQLEARCEELQRMLEEARSQERSRKRKERRRSSQTEEGRLGQRKISPLDGSQTEEEGEEEKEGDFGLMESGYSSTRTESSSPHSAREEELEEEDLKGRGKEEEDECSGAFSCLHTQDSADLEARLSEEEVARLSGELEWLREETRHGDRRMEELEEQVAVLVCENRSLSSSLEAERGRGVGLRPGRSSTVEEELLALQQVSEGLLCRRCLGLTEPVSPQDLVVLGTSQLLERAGSAVSCWAKKSGVGSSWDRVLLSIASRLRNSTSPIWLDIWLGLTILTTVVLGLLRGILLSFTSSL